MNVHECIRKRRAVREFLDKEVPDQVIVKILEAGRLAPSQRNRQPWHFIVVKDRGKLARLAEAAPYGRYIADAPLAIAVVLDNAKMGSFDSGRAIENMLLAAWEEGVGTCFTSGLDQDKVNAELNVPDSMEIAAVMPYGYPKEPATRNKKDRKPLTEVAHLEELGTPFPGA